MSAVHVVADVDFGQPSARKRGRSADYPYVPVIEHPDGRTENPARGRAYATRDEAVAAAQRQIDGRRRRLAEQLTDPRYRALRERYGLPREVQQMTSPASSSRPLLPGAAAGAKHVLVVEGSPPSEPMRWEASCQVCGQQVMEASPVLARRALDGPCRGLAASGLSASPRAFPGPSLPGFSGREPRHDRTDRVAS